ncbi:hypothetical protein B0H13DRAFT_1881956 [Mycena leptocephala]|nr:hypothetical protein B0H13DRAFT_1881956 [Mycena leptocephala]
MAISEDQISTRRLRNELLGTKNGVSAPIFSDKDLAGGARTSVVLKPLDSDRMETVIRTARGRVGQATSERNRDGGGAGLEHAERRSESHTREKAEQGSNTRRIAL